MNRLEQQTRIMQNLAIEINAKSLIDMLPDENRKRKYNGDLLVRGHTYLPGHKAYSYKVIAYRVVRILSQNTLVTASKSI